MIYLKNSLGTVYSLVGHVEHRQPTTFYSYHVPFQDQNYAKGLGLSLQEVILTFYDTTKSVITFNDIVMFSEDSVTWQTVYSATELDFPSVASGFYYTFTYALLISALRLGTVHSSGNMWGLSTTPTFTNGGNATAYAKLVYYAPRLYFPLTQNLIDFAGSSIVFTNANSKNYKGVSYPANTPIFDSGLYLSNQFLDVAKLTFANLTAHTIIAQIKSTRYPTDWVVGGSGGNLLTANQSNAETDLTGIWSGGGTLSRTTVAGEFYAGTAGFKIVSTASGDLYIDTWGAHTTGLTAGKYYCFSAYAQASTAAKNWCIRIEWYDAAHAFISAVSSTSVAASTSFTRLFVIGKAPVNAIECAVLVILAASVANDVLYADNLMFEQINETTILWDDGLKNKLYIDIPNSLLKWTDYTSTISCAFPTDQFLQENSSYIRKIITIVAIHNGATKEIHCKYDGGAFNDGSGALGALIWTNQITLGRFDGSLFNLIQYPYVLTATEYGNLNFTLNALKFNNFYIANKTAGTITYSNGVLTDENGNDITGLVSGSVPSVTTTGTVAMSDGLSSRWTAEIDDTYYP